MSPSLSDLREQFLDQEYREAYADDYLNTYIATQIQVLREQRGLSQEELAELIGTKQPGISRLENVNHSSWKTETLKRIAHALGVRLKISFETYGDLLFEAGLFGRKLLQRPKFEEDPVFAKESTQEIGTVANILADSAAHSGGGTLDLLSQHTRNRPVPAGVIRDDILGQRKSAGAAPAANLQAAS